MKPFMNPFIGWNCSRSIRSGNFSIVEDFRQFRYRQANRSGTKTPAPLFAIR